MDSVSPASLWFPRGNLRPAILILRLEVLRSLQPLHLPNRQAFSHGLLLPTEGNPIFAVKSTVAPFGRPVRQLPLKSI